MSKSRNKTQKTEKFEDNQEDIWTVAISKMTCFITEQNWRTKLIIDIQ